jgi:hypothetical protein
VGRFAAPCRNSRGLDGDHTHVAISRVDLVTHSKSLFGFVGRCLPNRFPASVLMGAMVFKRGAYVKSGGRIKRFRAL